MPTNLEISLSQLNHIEALLQRQLRQSHLNKNARQVRYLRTSISQLKSLRKSLRVLAYSQMKASASGFFDFLKDGLHILEAPARLLQEGVEKVIPGRAGKFLGGLARTTIFPGMDAANMTQSYLAHGGNDEEEDFNVDAFKQASIENLNNLKKRFGLDA